ncbi:hypothetical protein KNE206_53650 [Kitasatospora sp. NE20-6]
MAAEFGTPASFFAGRCPGVQLVGGGERVTAGPIARVVDLPMDADTGGVGEDEVGARVRAGDPAVGARGLGGDSDNGIRGAGTRPAVTPQLGVAPPEGGPVQGMGQAAGHGHDDLGRGVRGEPAVPRMRAAGGGCGTDAPALRLGAVASVEGNGRRGVVQVVGRQDVVVREQ